MTGENRESLIVIIILFICSLLIENKFSKIKQSKVESRPKGNWGTGEQRQKTLGKMGKGKKILVKQGVSTDRSPQWAMGSWYR